MIKAKNGKVDIKGKNDSNIIAEFMCIICSIAFAVIIPTHGKENLKSELYKIVDHVCETLEESEV